MEPIQQQEQYKVLLIGDSCIDKYVYGICERLNPEAPVPILNYKNIKTNMGMAWNVKNNLMSFGVNVDMITQKEEIIKTRYIDEKSNQQILRVDEDPPIRPLNYYFPEQKYDALVISDYDKGFLTTERIFELVDLFDGPIFIDSKKTFLPTKKCYIKINDLEYKKLKNPSDNLIITKGGKGAEYDGVLYSSENLNVFDVVGAGDTFLSALVVFYLKYAKIELAIPYANRAAGIAIQHQGTYVLNPVDIDAICN